MTGGGALERDRFWSAVNEALDAGADPLERGRVQEWIVENPADGDEVARLVRRLELVGPGPLRAPHLRRRKVAAAGLVLAIPVLALMLALFLARRSHRNDPEPADAAPASIVRAPRARILQYTLEIVRESAGSRASVVVEPGRVTRSRVAVLGDTTIVSRMESRSP